MEQKIKVWVWVLMHKDWKLLMSQRIWVHWDWSRQTPWWHLEVWEDVYDCARREVKEEIGIAIKNLKQWPYSNHTFPWQKHYITLRVIAEYDDWEIINLEPHKSSEWEWFDVNKLPQPLFLPFIQLQKDWYKVAEMIV